MTQAGLAEQPGRRAVLVVAGVGLIVAGWLILTPERFLGRVIPTGSAGTLYNVSLLTEVRACCLLLGILCLVIGVTPRALPALAARLALPLANADRWLSRGRRWPVLLAASVLATAGLFAAYSISRHMAFNSKAYDLGLHAQVFWNTSHGRLFASSVEVNNYLGDHVSAIILLLAPVYRLWPDPRALLILQAIVLACGAVPLALLARRLLRPSWSEGAYLASLVLVAIFLAYPALGFVNRFEFHEEVLVVPLLLLAFLSLEAGRPVGMSAALALALLCKEDVGLTVTAFGLFVAWRNRRWRGIGLAWAGLGVTWSLVALFVVIPAFRGTAADTLARYAWLGASPADILDTIAARPMLAVEHTLGEPRRLWMLFKSLLPTGFLALSSPALLVALPSVAINWLAGNLYQSSIYFHYAVTLIPVVFAATAYGMAKVRSQPITLHPLVLLWMVACALLAVAFDQFWQPATGPADWENYSLQHTVDRDAFTAAAALLPADGAVATTEAFAPHLAEREGLFLLHDPRILQVADQVDWVLVDLGDHRYGVQPKLYYGLLRWIALRRGLAPCFLQNDIVLLGPTCPDAPFLASYSARLNALQQSAADEAIDPALIGRLGPQYFVPR